MMIDVFETMPKIREIVDKALSGNTYSPTATAKALNDLARLVDDLDEHLTDIGVLPSDEQLQAISNMRDRIITTEG